MKYLILSILLMACNSSDGLKRVEKFNGQRLSDLDLITIRKFPVGGQYWGAYMKDKKGEKRFLILAEQIRKSLLMKAVDSIEITVTDDDFTGYSPEMKCMTPEAEMAFGIASKQKFSDKKAADADRGYKFNLGKFKIEKVPGNLIHCEKID